MRQTASLPVSSVLARGHALSDPLLLLDTSVLLDYDFWNTIFTDVVVRVGHFHYFSLPANCGHTSR
ncbi:hypothetical protein [Roseivirga seohaensis]|uniref:hypothetical protein n=1 Tax=Roseivirga seohaensis TaxID=1914963 RepID=UPI000B30666E|nr:hypothetical protein [Roseivirga seohaensis]